MIFYTIPPPAALAKYVRVFWVLEHDVPGGETYIHRTMADGCAELVFHYKGRFDEILPSGKIEKSFLSGVGGQTTQFNRYSIQESFGLFGVYLSRLHCLACLIFLLILLPIKHRTWSNCWAGKERNWKKE